MREVLYKSSFLRYYSSLFTRNASFRRRGLVLAFGAAWFGLMLTGIWLSGFSILGIFAFIICAIHGILRRSMPNLTGLMPLTSRRKIIYQYLAPILTGLLLIVCILLFEVLLCAFMRFYFLLNKLDTSIELFESQWWAIEEAFRFMGDYGTNFCFAFILLCYSFGMVFGFLPNTKYRVISVVAFYVFIYFAFYFATYHYAHNNYLPYNINIFSPFDAEVFEAMPMPGLCITLSWIFAIASFVGSVWYVNKMIGKKDF